MPSAFTGIDFQIREGPGISPSIQVIKHPHVETVRLQFFGTRRPLTGAPLFLDALQSRPSSWFPCKGYDCIASVNRSNPLSAIFDVIRHGPGRFSASGLPPGG